ncbi:nicotinamidase [Brachybacterium endophyticum]|uniref:Nicotinamidase n=1 Tax=Brachybacterium endophyticum TaxID=2182385 RepID=A0A2U2RJM9_9MICO|nr:isochorismatase family protein [Brachybacterium endophyticum]PWH06041.1 nicotinamidase [Brachybacterium endophyticum]
MSTTEPSAAPWLVVVDPQRIFADPSSKWASPYFDQVMERIALLGAHVGPERTLVTRWLPTADRAGSWGGYFEAWPFADVPAEDPLYDLVGPAQRLSSRPSIDEPTLGKWGAQLEEIVGKHPHLLLTGVSTDCCVLTTALAAADAGAHVDVVTDACAPSTGENGAKALEVMGLFGPQVSLTTSAEALREPAAA